MEDVRNTAVNNAASQEKQGPTMEQLKNWCDQLLTQRNQLAEKLNQITDVLNKLPWLFKVVENKDAFSPEFVELCSNEIMIIMTPPPAPEKGDEKGDEKEETKE